MPSLSEMSVDDVARFLINIGLEFDGDSFENRFGHDTEYYGSYGYECHEWNNIEYSIDRNGRGYGHLLVDVVAKTGGMDEGTDATIVFKVSDIAHERYFRKHGFYASYDGYTWDGDFVEVQPVVRPTTFYEEV